MPSGKLALSNLSSLTKPGRLGLRPHRTGWLPCVRTVWASFKRRRAFSDNASRLCTTSVFMMSVFPLDGEPRNRALTDIVAARDAALRLTGIEASAGLFLLVGCQRRLAAEFDALLLGVGPAARGAFENAAAFELRRNAKDGEDDLGEVGCSIEERFG